MVSDAELKKAKDYIAGSTMLEMETSDARAQFFGFEETLKHLINAAVRGEDDKLIGVTENIIVGQTVPIGTGLVKLKLKLG